MNAHSRREAAIRAIESVQQGAHAGQAETEVVDFKEETGTVSGTGQRQPISSEHEPAARALAAEVGCHSMSISEHGGILVVGVNDKASGPAAFVDTYLDLEWLRRRIFALTSPGVSLDMPEELEVEGKRIYLINVPPALSEVRVGGKLRARQGTDCVELDGDRAREFLERRQRYDWSAGPSELRLSEADAETLKRAQSLYRETQGHRPGSDLELVRRLGLAADNDQDPVLNLAGALLLGDYEPDFEQLDVQVVQAEGAPAQEREILKAPMIKAFDQAWELVDKVFPASTAIVGAQRRSVRVIPEEALREALVNAITHRDYRLPRMLIVSLSIGDPSETLKVTSPGDFPAGVPRDRLLATRSQPRNPVLADAMRLLGFAERQGIGIPTMFRALLRDGHPEPEIFAEGGDVICRLPGGRVDGDVRSFFDDLYRKDADLEYDVRAHIAITALLSRTPLRIERLVDLAQCSEGEAAETVNRLEKAGALERLLNGARSYRLTHDARTALQSRVAYKKRSSSEEQWDQIRAALDTQNEIGREDAATLLGVKPERASSILSKLRKEGRLDLVGKSRGRGVRYKLPRD